jgi:hypothetical protein
MYIYVFIIIILIILLFIIYYFLFFYKKNIKENFQELKKDSITIPTAEKKKYKNLLSDFCTKKNNTKICDYTTSDKRCILNPTKTNQYDIMNNFTYCNNCQNNLQKRLDYLNCTTNLHQKLDPLIFTDISKKKAYNAYKNNMKNCRNICDPSSL